MIPGLKCPLVTQAGLELCVADRGLGLLIFLNSRAVGTQYCTQFYALLGIRPQIPWLLGKSLPTALEGTVLSLKLELHSS